jgi:hypothetical protein
LSFGFPDDYTKSYRCQFFRGEVGDALCLFTEVWNKEIRERMVKTVEEVSSGGELGHF